MLGVFKGHVVVVTYRDGHEFRVRYWTRRAALRGLEGMRMIRDAEFINMESP